MTSVSQQNLMNVLLIGKELVRSRTLNELRDQLSAYAVPLFKAQGSILTLMAGGRLDPRTTECAGHCARKLKEEYYERYYKIDPLLRAPYTPYPYKVYTTKDVVPDEDSFEESEYYRDFLKPMSIHSHLFMNLGNGAEFIGNYLLVRDEASPPFDASEKGLAMLMEPFLSSALENVLLIDQNLRQEFAIRALLEKIPAKGIVILNGSLGVVHQNRNAEIILSMLYGPDESRQDLPALMRGEIERRSNELMQGLPDGPLPDHLVRFEVSPFVGTRRKIVVKISPIARQTKNPHILISLELEHNQLFIASKLEGYGLTQREIEIVACICEGMKDIDIGERLFISEHTVKNHNRHIFEKLGINKRTSLIQRILELGT